MVLQSRRHYPRVLIKYQVWRASFYRDTMSYIGICLRIIKWQRQVTAKVSLPANQLPQRLIILK